MDGLITNIQRFSVHDGPGIRTTVFLKGCQLSCIWCQNPEAITDYPEVLFFCASCINCGKCVEVCPKRCFVSEGETKFNSEGCDQCGICIDNCPVGAVQWSSRKRSSDDILKEVTRDREYYEVSGGGITLSGGEPLRQYDFCLDLATKAKALGLNLAVDTAGFVQTELLENIMNFIDIFLYDIKFIDEGLHNRYTGKSNTLTLNNFQKLYEANKQIIVRIPLIPGITDKKENLSQIKSFIRSYSKNIKIDYVPFNVLMRGKYKMLGKRCNI